MQNISLSVRAPNKESPLKNAPREARMLKLVGAELFVVSIQPHERELQASNDDHAGPLMLEGEPACPQTSALSLGGLIDSSLSSAMPKPWPVSGQNVMSSAIIVLEGTSMIWTCKMLDIERLQRCEHITLKHVCVAGEVRTQALNVAADAALLQAIATVAATVKPPADFQLSKMMKPSRSPTSGSSRRSRTPKKQPIVLLSTAVIAFEVRCSSDCVSNMTSEVSLPKPCMLYLRNATSGIC